MTLFDYAEGQAQKQAGMARAAAHMSDEWKEQALTVIWQVATSMAEFTGADIWNAGLDKPDEPRRLGIVMRDAASKGWIQKIPGRYRESGMPSQHRQPLQVWKSLVK